MKVPRDLVYESFLGQQLRDGLALSRESDLVELIPIGHELPTRYLARFRCKGLVKPGSSVEVANRFRGRHSVPARLSPPDQSDGGAHMARTARGVPPEHQRSSAGHLRRPAGTGDVACRPRLSGLRSHLVSEGDDARG